MAVYIGTLLNLDGIADSQGDIFDSNTGVELPSHDVQVTLDFNEPPEILGKARLFFRPGRLCYMLQLYDDKYKHVLENFVPCAGGNVVTRNGSRICHVKINYVSLTSNQNADSRIRPLRERK